MDLEKKLSWTQPHQPLPEEVCIYYIGHEVNSFCHEANSKAAKDLHLPFMETMLSLLEHHAL